MSDIGTLYLICLDTSFVCNDGSNLICALETRVFATDNGIEIPLYYFIFLMFLPLLVRENTAWTGLSSRRVKVTNEQLLAFFSSFTVDWSILFQLFMVVIVVVLISVAFYDRFIQRENQLLINFPLVGRLWYFFI